MCIHPNIEVHVNVYEIYSISISKWRICVRNAPPS
jgi:hypothetical protein